MRCNLTSYGNGIGAIVKQYKCLFRADGRLFQCLAPPPYNNESSFAPLRGRPLLRLSPRAQAVQCRRGSRRNQESLSDGNFADVSRIEIHEVCRAFRERGADHLSNVLDRHWKTVSERNAAPGPTEAAGRAAQTVAARESGIYGDEAAVYLTDVAGVKDRDGHLLSSINLTEVPSLIESGAITGGSLGGDGNLVASFSDATPNTYSYDTFAIRPSSANGTAQVFDTSLFKVEFVQVPEPGTLALLSLGGLGLLLRRRK